MVNPISVLGGNFYQGWLIVFLKFLAILSKRRGLSISPNTAGESKRRHWLRQQVCPNHWWPPVYTDVIRVSQKLWGLPKRLHTGTEAREGGWELPDTLKGNTICGESHSRSVSTWPRSFPSDAGWQWPGDRIRMGRMWESVSGKYRLL